MVSEGDTLEGLSTWDRDNSGLWRLDSGDTGGGRPIAANRGTVAMSLMAACTSAMWELSTGDVVGLGEFLFNREGDAGVGCLGCCWLK